MLEVFRNPLINFQFELGEDDKIDRWINGEDGLERETYWIQLGMDYM